MTTLRYMRTPYGLTQYTTDQAEGAIPNKTRIVKVKSEKGDTNPVGTRGVVIGSVSAELDGKPVIGYFVAWDHQPDVPVFCADFKIKARET
jgi:hypothetical protein